MQYLAEGLAERVKGTLLVHGCIRYRTHIPIQDISWLNTYLYLKSNNLCLQFAQSFYIFAKFAIFI
jgi:hypothetical protein